MADDAPHQEVFEAPHPGSPKMPRWTTGELIDAPRFTWRNWWGMLGPGLLMGGAAIGGGEWLMGPVVTARYGGALFWLATLSILSQVVYNLEICRYTLYCGEPIFNGKFRTLPGPQFWLLVYLLLDFGSVFPYLAASAATPLAAVFLGRIPDPVEDYTLLNVLSFAIFGVSLLPLIFGGKIYNALKAIMTFKIFVVFSFLLVLAIFYSTPSTWEEILTGFVKFGNIPVEQPEDRNGNGILDDDEYDWDGDGRADVVEEIYKPSIDSDGDGKPDKYQRDEAGNPILFNDVDGDGIRDGDSVDNIFVALFEGRALPPINFSLIGVLCALVAISGQGGLSNTPISNYTRDQGWGMGHHVGAIPSIVGGHELKLAHVGCVFQITAESLRRWKRWYWHVMRDQLFVWMPACFIGLALPSMLSVQFLRRGTVVEDLWVAAGMTADGVRDAVSKVSGAYMGDFFWFMTLFCGFLVLGPSMAVTADGVIRRWVDVFWTASARLRDVDPGEIRKFYFGVLCAYAVFGFIALGFIKKGLLVLISTNIYNYALGFSCWHTLVVNMVLLPREIRPGWFVRITLFLAGAFFIATAVLKNLSELGVLG
ncbi:MAG: hypothetical protein KatS3mg105_1837 [Gemmatales bacterium]|nr:MAG: hypothetical protein KatS3mg105_1837 [Gemmatales bacterium]